MTVLNPWALLSLISLIILLLIYILKPNYQAKMISSTYIWKLSLKYKKKKLPISKLKNILLIICQVLILTLLSVVLIKPVKITGTKVENEVILILDASASMRTVYDEETRFTRAIELVKQKTNEVLDKDGIVTIVVAANEPYFLVKRLTADDRVNIMAELDEIMEEDKCTYGSADLDDATKFCHDIINENPDASIFVYTDQNVKYITDGLKVENVQKQGEYNVAILDANSSIVDNYYLFEVDVACYGRDMSIDLSIEINGANLSDGTQNGSITFVQSVDLDSDNIKKIIFINDNLDFSNYPDDENTIYYYIPQNERVISYNSVIVSIDEEDSFTEDNVFSICGGTKEKIKILYASSNRNRFFRGAIFSIQDTLRNRFDIEITDVKDGEIPNSGYDLYIYEHEMMPSTTPNDGIVIYADPLSEIAGAGFRLGNFITYKNNLSLTEENMHPIINKVNADNITISRLTSLVNYEDTYDVIMTCDNKPALLLRDDEDCKTIIMLFSLHYSNLPIKKEFPTFIYNIFDYFLPSTVDGNSFEVNDKVTVRSRSNEITVEGNGQSLILDSFPTSVTLDLPGVYTFTQTTHFNKTIKEQVFVKIPKIESNIFNELDTIENPLNGTSDLVLTKDLLFYFALGLSALVFIEWILKGKDTI